MKLCNPRKNALILAIALAGFAPAALASLPAPVMSCTNGAPCDDGNPCTLNDTCVNGACVGGAPPPAVYYCSTAGTTTIPSGPGAATPYPSPLVVGNAGTTICKVRVVLDGLNHTNPDDIDMMLSGPGGKNAKIMSDVGGSQDIGNLGLILDDDAAGPIPDGGPLFAAPFGGGIYKPTDVNDGIDTFPAPAPTPLGGSALSVFQGSNPNGTWNLWVVDDKALDSGSLGRWCLWISFLCTTDAQCADNDVCTTDTCVNGVCSNAGQQAPPAEVQGVHVDSDKQTYRWTAEASVLGYHVVRGSLSSLPVGPGGGDEACSGELSDASLLDTTDPDPGTGFFYVVNAVNCFDNGSYGTQSDGTPRTTTTCP